MGVLEATTEAELTEDVAFRLLNEIALDEHRDGLKAAIVGKRVRIRKHHPLAGAYGTVKDVLWKDGYGLRPVVRGDDGTEFFVLHPSEWKLLGVPG